MFILFLMFVFCMCFFFSSRRRHTRLQGDWSSDVCSSDLFVVFPEWIYEVIWSSACPALLQCPRRNQVAPGIDEYVIVPHGGGALEVKIQCRAAPCLRGGWSGLPARR